ncbi:hypothetical protein C8F01DRAFT_1177676 [Mycena amicta]|nr:hypothetical protein C8F01DRAFT_1177676 [Mycena amicta]
MRPATPTSVHSWWSDSNSVGATIPLHSLAKPLMKLMYHRQALAVLKRRALAPLTEGILQELKCYLTFKGIQSSTRALVLEHLLRRFRGSTDGSEKDLVILDSDLLAFAADVVRSGSPDPLNVRLLCAACELLEHASAHPKNKDVFAEMNLKKPLISLLRFVELYLYRIFSHALINCRHKNLKVRSAAEHCLPTILRLFVLNERNFYLARVVSDGRDS